MREIRLRWSPRRNGWQVIPGDKIIESGAKPFQLHWQKLIDADLFRQSSMEHDWPRISDAANHRDRIREAVLNEKHIPDGIHPGCREQICHLSLALVNDEMTLEDYFDLMEKMTP